MSDESRFNDAASGNIVYERDRSRKKFGSVRAESANLQLGPIAV